jgi:hypothetical protein
MQNGHVESFHSRLRDECLNAHWFRTLHDITSTLATWHKEHRHSSLGYRTPQEVPPDTGREQGHGPAPFQNHNDQPNREISSYDWMRNRRQIIFP